jgi:hypothetical protein
MTDITDPQVVSFVNVYLRPIMEEVRDLQLQLTDAAAEYAANISGALAGFVNTDPLVDGRAAEGVTQITKQEITDTLAHLNAILTELNAAGASTLRAKLTVRPPSL